MKLKPLVVLLAASFAAPAAWAEFPAGSSPVLAPSAPAARGPFPKSFLDLPERTQNLAIAAAFNRALLQNGGSDTSSVGPEDVVRAVQTARERLLQGQSTSSSEPQSMQQAQPPGKGSSGGSSSGGGQTETMQQAQQGGAQNIVQSAREAAARREGNDLNKGTGTTDPKATVGSPAELATAFISSVREAMARNASTGASSAESLLAAGEVMRRLREAFGLPASGGKPQSAPAPQWAHGPVVPPPAGGSGSNSPSGSILPPTVSHMEVAGYSASAGLSGNVSPHGGGGGASRGSEPAVSSYFGVAPAGLGGGPNPMLWNAGPQLALPPLATGIASRHDGGIVTEVLQAHAVREMLQSATITRR